MEESAEGMTEGKEDRKGEAPLVPLSTEVQYLKYSPMGCLLMYSISTYCKHTFNQG